MPKLEDWEYEMIKAFCHNMLVRIEDGREKYGMDYLQKDNLKEIEWELFDIACYACLFWMKLRKLREEYEISQKKT